jgi:hypothetical protein
MSFIRCDVILRCIVIAISSRRQQKEEARARRLAAEAAQLAAAQRRKRLRGLASAAVLVAAVAAGGIAVAVSGGASPTGGGIGPEGVPVPAAGDLADASTSGKSVDGIQCLGTEQLLFHIHAHLVVFVDGQPRRIPYGVGISAPQVESTPQGPYVAGGGCFYWLHTHAADGIIHIESPVSRTFTLGNFFDVWGQPLSANRVGPARGQVTAFYNGRRWAGDPRQIPLTRHAQIQLDVGAPLSAPVHIGFPGTL